MGLDDGVRGQHPLLGRVDHVLFEGGLSDMELEAHADLLATRPRGALLPWFTQDFGQCWFDMRLDMGSWRDGQRHRPMIWRPALLTAYHGFEPWYLDQLPAPLAREAAFFVEEQARRVRALTDDPVLRQYYLGMGFRVRTRVTAGLFALIYFLELRSGKAIHPTLRRRVLEMARLFRGMYPNVALHVDEDPDDWSLRRAGHVITTR